MTKTSLIQQPRPSAKDVARRFRGQWIALASMASWILLLFLCAGTIHWSRGWIATCLYLASMIATGAIVHRTNHSLLERRGKWMSKDTKAFDKVFLSLFWPLTLIQPAAAGLDVVRYRWSSMPLWTFFPAAAIFLVGMALITWTLSTNPFAENSVRIQTDQGHRVIRSGPYAFVRHPMYLGSVLIYPATGCIFGSKAALFVGAIMSILMIARTALEDRTLWRELPGYAEYSLVTRFRLLPGIW